MEKSAGIGVEPTFATLIAITLAILAFVTQRRSRARSQTAATHQGEDDAQMHEFESGKSTHRPELSSHPFVEADANSGALTEADPGHAVSAELNSGIFAHEMDGTTRQQGSTMRQCAADQLRHHQGPFHWLACAMYDRRVPHKLLRDSAQYDP